MKKPFASKRHPAKKTEIYSVVLTKVASATGVTLELTIRLASAIRELAVYTHTNRWFLATERIPRKIGQFLKKMRLRNFFLDPNQQVKVLGVYDPSNERWLSFVDRQIRRFRKALEECSYGLLFAHEIR